MNTNSDLLEAFKDKHLQLAKTFDCQLVVWPLLVEKYSRVWEGSGSGSPHKHHYGDYGLAIHTQEVIELCLGTANVYDNINTRELFLSALFHDVGKWWDYQKVDGEWTYTEHSRNVHHISRGCWVWRELAQGIEKENVIDRVSHNILSHHGCREWGSPISPNSKEAFILHYCDSISARVYDGGNIK